MGKALSSHWRHVAAFLGLWLSTGPRTIGATRERTHAVTSFKTVASLLACIFIRKTGLVVLFPLCNHSHEF
ncbi:hypothetical protein V8C35DRAFT_305293 [Trichoderma chlorosporum]